MNRPLHLTDLPLISVIMPVHNAGCYLIPAVTSILQQSYETLELILVDDRSCDGAIHNLPVSLTQDLRFRVVSSTTPGVVAAMQTGVGYMSGDFVARMDADDIAMPDRLLKQLNYLQQHPEIGIAGAQVEIFSDGPLGQGFQLYQQWINALCDPEDIAREIFIESPIPNPTAMFRTQVYTSLGGYRDPEWAEDYDMWLRAHARGIKMGKPDGMLLKWRDHDRRLTRCDARYDNDLFLKAKAYFLSRGQLQQRAAIIWGTGPTGCCLYDRLNEQQVEVVAFVDVHPRRIGGRKRGLPVLPADAISEPRDELIVAAVGARGARQEIREALLAMGKREGRDFLFAA